MPTKRISYKEFKKNPLNFIKKSNIENIIFAVFNDNQEITRILPSIKSGADNYFKNLEKNEICCDVDFRELKEDEISDELRKKVEISRKLPDSAFGCLYDKYKHLLNV